MLPPLYMQTLQPTGRDCSVRTQNSSQRNRLGKVPGLAQSTNGAGGLAATPLKPILAVWGLSPQLSAVHRVSRKDGVSFLLKACCESRGECLHPLAGVP